MSKVLFDEQPLIVDHVLARELGLNGAIVVQQIHYWLEINKKSNKNFYDGRYWTFNSITQWHKENFDFWSYDTVKRTFMKLEKMGLLIVGNYNKETWDRTKWYTIDYQILDTVTQCNSANCTKISKQFASRPQGNLHLTIPENTPETKPETNNIIIINKDSPVSLDDGEVRKIDFKRIKEYYSKFIEGKDIIPFNIEKKLYEYYNILGLELVIFAIDKACEANAKNFNYIKAVLNNLVNNNITTLEEAQEFKPNKKTNKTPSKDATPEEIYNYIFGN